MAELEACEAMLRDDVLMRARQRETHDNMNTAQAAMNVHTLCRICAEAREHMEEIFGAAQLHTKINLCLPIKVCESDSLSLSVCHSCVARLENSFKLATLSQRSDVILRDLQQRQNEEQRQIQVQQQNEEQKHQPCDPIEHKVAMSQISAVNSRQTSSHNSPNISTSSECENDAEKNYNLKPLSVQYTRLSQRFLDTFTVKVEQDLSESSQEQMRNDDTNLQDIKLEPQFSNTNENYFMEENHTDFDVRIKTEVEDTAADESSSNLHHVPFASFDNENLQDEDPLQHEITSEIIIKSEYELSNVEESRKNHLAIHSDVRPFKCDKCSSSFKLMCNLQKHNKSVHSEVKPFECKKCDKSFYFRAELLSHGKVHSDVRPFACEVCGKMFKSKHYVVKHMSLHKKELDFKCKQCNKKFKSKHHLYNHKQIHVDVRKFQCTICDMKFKVKYHLSRHMLVHSDKRPFSCDICAKSYKSKRELKQHGIVHKNSYDFKCNLCDAECKRKADLVSHIKYKHSDARPFQCNECEKSYKHKSKLRNHMAVHLNSR